jgi:hypothetical protein
MLFISWRQFNTGVDSLAQKENGSSQKRKGKERKEKERNEKKREKGASFWFFAAHRPVGSEVQSIRKRIIISILSASSPTVCLSRACLGKMMMHFWV